MPEDKRHKPRERGRIHDISRYGTRNDGRRPGKGGESGPDTSGRGAAPSTSMVRCNVCRRWLRRQDMEWHRRTAHGIEPENAKSGRRGPQESKISSGAGVEASARRRSLENEGSIRAARRNFYRAAGVRCHLCSCSFPPEEYTAHMQSAHGIEVVECTHCAELLNADQLAEHVRDRHGGPGWAHR
jgi:hypothetical protein